MPEINKIQIGQTVYTLADEVARSGSNTISLNNVRRYVSDFTTSASIPQGTKVSFVRCSAKPPRHLIAQYLVGSNGTLTLFKIDTDGSCSLTPINQDSGATERFACSLVVPC